MGQECWNCGADDHRNFQCPHPKSSGSTKKALKKKHRSEKPEEVHKSFRVFKQKIVEKENILAGEPIPFYTVKSCLDYAHSYLDRFDFLEKLDNKPVDLQLINQYLDQLLAMEPDLKFVLENARIGSIYADNVSRTAQSPDIGTIYKPNQMELDILVGQAGLLKTRANEIYELKRKLYTVYRNLNMDITDINNLQSAIKRKLGDPQHNSDENMEQMTELYSQISLKMERIHLLKQEDFDDLKQINLWIHNKFQALIQKKETIAKRFGAEKLEKEKALIRTKHEEHFKLLSKNAYNIRSFLKLACRIYPPKRKEGFAIFEDLLANPNTTPRTLLMKAFLFYHHDRQDPNDLEWIVVCEEITKHLTNMK